MNQEIDMKLFKKNMKNELKKQGHSIKKLFVEKKSDFFIVSIIKKDNIAQFKVHKDNIIDINNINTTRSRSLKYLVRNIQWKI